MGKVHFFLFFLLLGTIRHSQKFVKCIIHRNGKKQPRDELLRMSLSDPLEELL